MTAIVHDLSIALGLLIGLLAALEAGFRLGRRASAELDPRAPAQVGAVQGAILGLLALLLGFSFASAGARFLEKQDLIVTEANAIGTAYLRADLLDSPHREGLREALREYALFRVGLSRQIRDGLDRPTLDRIDGQLSRIWSAAITGVDARPTAMLGVLPPVNQVIDLHSIRVAAGRKHLPLLVMGLLIASSLLAIGVIGYGSGLGGHRRPPLTVPLALLIGIALWITIDLDQPRAGLMQLNDAPLRELMFD